MKSKEDRIPIKKEEERKFSTRKVTRSQEAEKMFIDKEEEEVTVSVSDHHRHHHHRDPEQDHAVGGSSSPPYLHDPGLETAPRRGASPSPSSQWSVTGTAAGASSSWGWSPQLSPSTSLDDSLSRKGASGGTGAAKEFSFGESNGALHAVGQWPCAASVSGKFVPPSGMKTTAGGCKAQMDQLQAGRCTNPREGLGLATPGSRNTRNIPGE